MAKSKFLDIVIRAKDEASEKFKELNSQLDKLKPQFQKMAVGGTIATGAITFGITQAIQASNQMESALVGLSTVASAFGVDADLAKQSAIELASDGLMSVNEASEGLKNLIPKLGLERAIDLMNGFKDTASFNRQGTLAFGEAIVGATQGIKNMNSIMVDNAGVTKNLSVIMSEQGFTMQDLDDKVKGASASTALYNGLLEQMEVFSGDAEKASETLAGKQSKLATQVFNTRVAIGEALAPAISQLVDVMTPAIVAIGKWVKEHPVVTKYISLGALAVAGLVAVIGTLGLIIPAIITGLIAVKIAVLAVASSMTIATGGLILIIPLIIAMIIHWNKVSLVIATAISMFKAIGRIMLVGVRVIVGYVKDIAMAFVNWKDILKDIGSGLWKLFKGDFSGAMDSFKNTAMGAFKNTASEFSGMGAQMDTIMSDMTNEVAGYAEMWDDTNEKTKTGLESVSTKITEVKDTTATMPPPPPAVGEGVDKLGEKFKELTTKIKDFKADSNEAINSVAETIAGIKEKMDELLSGKIKSDREREADMGKAIFEQQEKIVEAQKEVDDQRSDLNEKRIEKVTGDNFKAHNAELARMQNELAEREAFFEKEKEALERYKHLEAVFAEEVANARDRARKTDFERYIEDFNARVLKEEEEFSRKKFQLEKELAIEEEKMAKLIEIRANAEIELDKALAREERMTIDSVNRRIDSYNALARAMSLAQSGTTSSRLSVSSGVTDRINQVVNNINIKIESKGDKNLSNDVMKGLKNSNLLAI